MWESLTTFDQTVVKVSLSSHFLWIFDLKSTLVYSASRTWRHNTVKMDWLRMHYGKIHSRDCPQVPWPISLRSCRVAVTSTCPTCRSTCPAIVTRKPNCKTGWRLEFPNMTHFDCYLTFLSQRFTSLYWETYCHFVKYYFLHDIHVWCWTSFVNNFNVMKSQGAESQNGVQKLDSNSAECSLWHTLKKSSENPL